MYLVRATCPGTTLSSVRPMATHRGITVASDAASPHIFTGTPYLAAFWQTILTLRRTAMLQVS